MCIYAVFYIPSAPYSVFMFKLFRDHSCYVSVKKWPRAKKRRSRRNDGI
jgi:hypothetical protein